MPIADSIARVLLGEQTDGPSANRWRYTLCIAKKALYF
jgi:hypothetical protein